MSDFGLHFYNARWYDSSLGRFAQADTILPGGVQWDRYAYVNNSPMMFTDPTGHKCNPDDGCNKRPNFFTQSGSSGEDVLNRKILSEGANNLYDLYLAMHEDKDGWWWDKYGSGGFTIWEFMAIQYGLERDWYPDLELYGEAVANGAAAWCQGQPTCSMTEAEWNLNFLAGYSKRPQQGVLDCLQNPRCDIASKVREPSQAGSMSIVAGIQQRLPLGADPLSLDDPFSVGNISLSEDVLRKMIQKGMVRHAWGGGNTMVVLTLCQTRLYYYAAANDGKGDVNKANYGDFCGK